MKRPIWAAAVWLAALGAGLVLTGILSSRKYESPIESSIQLNSFKDFSEEVSTGQNTVKILSSTETVLEAENTGTAKGEYVPQTKFPETMDGYTLPESVQFQDGSIGQLIIEKIDVNAPVYETDDEMEAMRKGIAHYKITSAWEGNIGLCAHNGTASYCWFHDLNKLETGDEVVYKTALGSRSYQVSMIKEISETDWSMFSRTEDNRLTMTTCIDGKPDKRLCVQAIQKEGND